MHEDYRQPTTVILVNDNGMGRAEQALQHTLAGTYFRLLADNDFLPGVICFYAEGVKLTCEGSPILEQLQQLEEKGVQLVICATCLKHFDLQDEVAVGVVGGMTDIIEAQWRADKVITL